MNVFEELYLACKAKLTLIPGPLEIQEPFYSVNMQQLETYLASEVAQTFEQLSSVKALFIKNSTHQSWYDCKWKWAQESRWIELGFSIFDEVIGVASSAAVWGGSPLIFECTCADILHLWLQVKMRHPGVWLHDEETCRVLTPHSFIEVCAMPRLQQALNNPDREACKQAKQELENYRCLGYRS